MATRKSRIGDYVILGWHVIKSWSEIQSLVVFSSDESELYAVLRVSDETLDLMALLQDLGVQCPGREMGRRRHDIRHNQSEKLRQGEAHWDWDPLGSAFSCWTTMTISKIFGKLECGRFHHTMLRYQHKQYIRSWSMNSWRTDQRKLHHYMWLVNPLMNDNLGNNEINVIGYTNIVTQRGRVQKRTTKWKWS